MSKHENIKLEYENIDKAELARILQGYANLIENNGKYCEVLSEAEHKRMLKTVGDQLVQIGFGFLNM